MKLPSPRRDERSLKTIANSLSLAINKRKSKKLPSPTKFSYLINNGILSQEELRQAIAEARTNGMDIETLLLEKFKIKRNDFGKSLEEFYNVPYYGYSSDIVLPSSLFTGLNTNFLLKNNWLPIAKDEEGNKITVLIDNPANQDRIQSIKLIFTKKALDFKVGLKADINDFLKATPEDDEGPDGT